MQDLPLSTISVILIIIINGLLLLKALYRNKENEVLRVKRTFQFHICNVLVA